MTLRFLLSRRRSIQVHTSVFFTEGHALLRHQLQQLQRRRVGEIAIGGEDVVDLPTVLGPRAHSTRRMLSSASVGRDEARRAMAAVSTINFVVSTK